MLNKTSGGRFQIDSPAVKEIKDKVTGIEGIRTKVFHFLLDGSEELRKKLNALIKDYEDGKATQ